MAIRSIAAAAAALLLVGVAGYARLRPADTRALDVFGEAPAFALIDQLERPARSEDFLGRIVVANFIYTSCRDICPLLSLQMQALQDRLRQEQLLGTNVQLLSFTVDPARDTPPVLLAYAERHRADPDAWRFLTGADEDVRRLVVDGFHLGVQAVPPIATEGSDHPNDPTEGYEVIHSGRIVLIDRHWRIRAYYDWRDLDIDHALEAIRQLLRS